MKDPFRDLFKHINRHLHRAGVDVSVGAEVMIPVVVSVGTLEHETTLDIRVTEDGWSIVRPEAQAERIEKEIFDCLTDGFPEYQYRSK